MFWDSIPTELADPVVTAAIAEAEALDLGAVELRERARRLKDRGEALRNAGSDELGILLISDGLVCDLYLTDAPYAERWGPLAPMMEFEGGVYPPPLASFPDALEPYFRQRGDREVEHSARARYHDFVWLRWHHFDSAKEAHASYLRASEGADLANAVSSMTAVEYMQRAAELSATLGIDRDQTRDALASEIRRGLPLDTPGYAAHLGDALCRLASKGDSLCLDLVEEFRREAEAGAAKSRTRERAYLETAERLARASGETGLASGFHTAQAASVEAEAHERESEGALIRQALLSEAAKLYADSGASSEVQRLKPALSEAAEAAAKELKTITGEVQIPHEHIEAEADRLVRDLAPGAALRSIALNFGLWQSRSEVEAGLLKAQEAHPLLHLFGHTTLTYDGRYFPDPADEDARHEVELMRHYIQDAAPRLALLGSVIDVLRGRGVWTADSLIEALRESDEEIASACERGVAAFEDGDAWLAVHALVPQLERSVRLLAKRAGASVERLSRRGGLEWAPFGALLDEPLLVDLIGESLAFCLKALFESPGGPNWRNEVAHGALDPSLDHQLAARATLFAILTLAATPLPADAENAD